MQRIGQSFRWVAVQAHIRNVPLQKCVQSVPHTKQVNLRFRQPFPRQFRRDPQADDQRHTLGTRAQSVFLLGAREDSQNWRFATHIKDTNALGRVELVAGECQQIYSQLIHVDGDLARRLRRVSVQEDASLTRDA